MDNEQSRTSADTWPDRKEAYELGEVIGVGATATVYRALCTPRNENCAIKCINLEKVEMCVEGLSQEIQAMSQCNHANVLSLNASFVVGEELWLVMPLLDGGSMLDILRKKIRAFGKGQTMLGVIDEAAIATVLREVLKGLEYFHAAGQIHRDIKACNVLLSKEGAVQIADFGVASWLAVAGGDMSRQKTRHTFVGTPCWMAPEVMEQVNGYDYKADIWSLGILAIELATGTAPYYKFPPMKVLMMTLQNEPPSLETNAECSNQYKAYGKSFRKLIADCLQKDPAKRPTACELLKYPFFKKAKDKKYLVRSLITNLADVPMPRRRRHSCKQKNSEGNEENWDFDYDSTSSFSSSGSEGEEETMRLSESLATIIPDGSDMDTIRAPPVEQTTFNLVLRVRNHLRKLHAIDFPYIHPLHTSLGTAHELLQDGLIDPRDLVTVAAKLHDLIELALKKDDQRKITFALNSGVAENEVADESSFTGFAELALAD